MTTRFNPFSAVGCKRGAPMGRRSNTKSFTSSYRSVCAKHQGGYGDGYDSGGAYWGCPANVWAVWYHGYGSKSVEYIRADNAAQAKAEFNGELYL